MQYVILYLGMLFLGYFVASRLRARAEKFGFLSGVLMVIVYVLVFIMGLRMGINEQVTSNLGSIGLQALALTICCIAGSMLAVFGARKIMKMDRYGNTEQMRREAELQVEAVDVGTAKSTMTTYEVATGSEMEPEPAGVSMKSEMSESGKNTDKRQVADANFDKKQDSDGNSDIKSTIYILALVVIGMLAGYFFIADFSADRLQQFDAISGNLLTIFLCLLLFTVGFDMGLTGTVAKSMRGVGLRVLVFPFATIAGTLVFGAACSMVMGFSLKEGLAMSAGFGWYTYAPTVIADAGSQYMIASAVSFMHNVLREVSGIVLIPVLAKQFGYIESTAVPGVAAADVCVPIVERSCRQDTVVYTVIMGIVLTIATSVLVPLFMGL